MSAVPDDLGERWAEDLRALKSELTPGSRDTAGIWDDPDVLPVPFTWAKDYPALAAPVTIVAGLLEAGTLAIAYGESNTGKSTLALDIALAIARGTPWRGRTTRRGLVLWIALESAAGLRRRVHAYRRHHGLDDADGLLFADVTGRVHLLDDGHVQRVIATIATMRLSAGADPALVVVDTVARALAGGDENDGRDMGRLVAACDLIRTRTGCAVLLIHHSGKDSTRGARGHSSLRAAVDTEIEVSGQTNPRQARVTKQRDLPSGDVLAFDLEPVEIATDDAGKPITACVVVHRDDGTPARRAPAGKNQQQLLGAVREHVRATGCDLIATPVLREIAKAQGVDDRRRFGEAREALERDGWLVPCVGGYRLAGAKL